MTSIKMFDPRQMPCKYCVEDRFAMLKMAQVNNVLQDNSSFAKELMATYHTLLHTDISSGLHLLYFKDIKYLIGIKLIAKNVHGRDGDQEDNIIYLMVTDIINKRHSLAEVLMAQPPWAWNQEENSAASPPFSDFEISDSEINKETEDEGDTKNEDQQPQQPQQLQTQQPQQPQIQQPQQPTLQELMPPPPPYAAQPIRVLGSSNNKRPSTLPRSGLPSKKPKGEENFDPMEFFNQLV
ncbi:unnamed protein product [Mytilus coruscus]|uniref:Uncharacterized protein n=1 Tax=Mytilus coruscus TaxID=42192 RepID=A0A6J8A7P2_MYTCO|nr:unnamed protein product [Mytilus coruscus]